VCYTVHDPNSFLKCVEVFFEKKSVTLWESITLFENVVFLDLFGTISFFSIFLHYFWQKLHYLLATKKLHSEKLEKKEIFELMKNNQI